jgi:DNA repair ATPase RecN
MTSLETFKQDMELVNSFAGKFIDNINTGRQKVKTILQDLEKALSEEQANKLVLASMENTISEKELDKISQEFAVLKETFMNKHSEYSYLIQSNTNTIQNIAKTIKDKNERIQEINSTMSNIDQLLSKYKIV